MPRVPAYESLNDYPEKNVRLFSAPLYTFAHG